ncbi:MAG TPA: hypothetical protein VNY73_09665 [Bacteroidia bacterium]|jgi:hypothetical protein|nr:hypothetical protein [Bacteroidia bacterium]
MSSQGKSLFLLFVSFIFMACQENRKETDEILYKEKSVKASSLSVYNYVFKIANDTLKNWIIYDLPITKAYKVSNWSLDDLICFNKKADQCIMCIYRQYNEQVNNALDYFYGIKIKNKWYFFSGATVYLFSENYGKIPKTALSFSELHEIALKEVYGGYLTKDGEISEDFFKDHFENSGWGITSGKKEDFERVYLEKVNNNWYWAKKDTLKEKALP